MHDDGRPRWRREMPNRSAFDPGDAFAAERRDLFLQPGRQGNGDWAQYTAADETIVLKGNPARVEDTEQGSTEGGRLTLYLRENKVIADDSRGEQSTGRVRSTHKVRKQ